MQIMETLKHLENTVSSANELWWGISSWFSEGSLKDRIELAEDLIYTLQSEINDWEKELQQSSEPIEFLVEVEQTQTTPIRMKKIAQITVVAKDGIEAIELAKTIKVEGLEGIWKPTSAAPKH